MKKILVLALLIPSAAMATNDDEHQSPQWQGQGQEQQQHQQQVVNANASAAAALTSTFSSQVTTGGTSIKAGDVKVDSSIHTNTPDDIKIRNTPSMNAPPLVTSNDTCVVSASGAVSLPGFGFSLGSGDPEENCVMLKNARELWNMGFRAAGIALMCTNEDNRYALEVTGYSCPTNREKNSWISRFFGASKYKKVETKQ